MPFNWKTQLSKVSTSIMMTGANVAVQWRVMTEADTVQTVDLEEEVVIK